MSIIAYVVFICLIAGVCYWVSTQAWISPFFKSLVYGVGGLFAILLTLQAIGVLDELRSMQVPHVGLEVQRSVA